MAGRTSFSQVAQREADRITAAVADELRTARLATGLTQAQVGLAIGIGRRRVSAVERGASTGASLAQVARQAAALGLRMSVKFYPVGGALRDTAQVRYISRFVDRVRAAWRVSLDVPVPLPGDLRAIDVLLVGVCTIAVEIVTQLRDLQAVIRAAQLKQRDIGATRLVIVVAGTHRNRRALADAHVVLAAAFELDTQRTMAALRDGRDPGRDAIVVLSA
jgi:transcriptional regulator with XRE-family HTH domain